MFQGNVGPPYVVEKEKHLPPGSLDGSLTLEFECRLIFNCFQSFLTDSLLTVVMMTHLN